MKLEKLLMKPQIFVGTNWIFLTRMYKQENTLHDKKFSISLSFDASLLISFQVLAAYPSPDGSPRAGQLEEPLDWRIRQSRSKRRFRGGGRSRGRSRGCTTWVLTMGSGHETGSYCGKGKCTTYFLQFPKIPPTDPFQSPCWVIYTQCPLSRPASLGLK